MHGATIKIRITGILHVDQYTFFILSRSVLLRMQNVSDESCAENQNTHFVFDNIFFSRKSCRLWDIVEIYRITEPERPQMTTWRMRIACWVSKPTNTHSEYVTLTAFPLQQWLHERSSMLRYTYIVCVVIILDCNREDEVCEPNGSKLFDMESVKHTNTINRLLYSRIATNFLEISQCCKCFLTTSYWGLHCNAWDCRLYIAYTPFTSPLNCTVLCLFSLRTVPPIRPPCFLHSSYMSYSIISI